MNLFSLHLQACFPERNIFRAYNLWVGQDLFGDWLLQITYGRIGAKGMTKTYVFCSEQKALSKLKSILRLRASAYKRLGCAYRLVEFKGDDSLLTYFPLVGDFFYRPASMKTAVLRLLAFLALSALLQNPITLK